MNAKLNEFQAALGILLLEHYDEEISRRARVAATYREQLAGLPGIRCFSLPASVGNSLQYFVVRVQQEECGISRDDLLERLKAFNVFARRYFYPLCNT